MKRSLLGGVAVAACVMAGACTSSGGDATDPVGKKSAATKTTAAPPPSDVTVTGPVTGGRYGVMYNPTPAEILMDPDRAQALRAIAAFHSFRFFGLVFLVPGLVGPALPTGFATSAA